MCRQTSQLCIALVVVTVLVLALAGCGPVPISGGTSGRLTSDGNPLADFQITVHQQQGNEVQTLGFAVTASDGSFSFAALGGERPLTLNPGEYCFTLESVGSPVQIPKVYQQVDVSPLKLPYTAEQELILDVPGLRYP